MFELNHVCSEHTASTGFDALPVGDYTCVIVEATQKPTKAGTGAYLNLKIQVADGAFANRIFFDLLNLWNPSSTAVEIAQGTLTAIGDALGLATITDPAQICGKHLTVSLKQEVYMSETQNKVSAYKKYEKFAAQAPVGQQPPVYQQAPVAAQQPPVGYQQPPVGQQMPANPQQVVGDEPPF